MICAPRDHLFHSEHCCHLAFGPPRPRRARAIKPRGDSSIETQPAMHLLPARCAMPEMLPPLYGTICFNLKKGTHHGPLEKRGVRTGNSAQLEAEFANSKRSAIPNSLVAGRSAPRSPELDAVVTRYDLII